MDPEEESINSAHTRLKEGLALRDVLNPSGTFFEVMDSLDDREENSTNPETIFDFEKLKDHLNFDCLSGDDSVANDTPFAEIQKKMTSITEDGKVTKKVLRAGSGSVVPQDCSVYVHYSAYKEFDACPYDSTYLRSNKPYHVQLSKGILLPGLEIGIQSMRTGEMAHFIIHADYAFGRLGCPPRIPPDSTILVKVELIKWIDSPEVDGFDELNMEDHLVFQNVLKKAKTNHKLGNAAFASKRYKQAANIYKRSVNMLQASRLKDEKEEEEMKKLALKCFTNLAICFNELKIYPLVCVAAQDAIYTDRSNALKNPKLQYNWGRALLNLEDFRRSEEHLMEASRLVPEDPKIKEALTLLHHKRRANKMGSISWANGLKNKFAPIPATKSSTLDQFRVEVNTQMEDFVKGTEPELLIAGELSADEEKVCRHLANEHELQFNRRLRNEGIGLHVHHVFHKKKPVGQS